MTVEQTTVDPAKVQATMGKVVEELGVALGTLTATLGWRAGLWQAMAGAGPLTNFFRITAPLIAVTLMPLLISAFAYNFNNFVLISLLTDGRPDYLNTKIPAGTNDILVSYTYRIAFQDSGQNFGLAAAISTMIFVLVAILSLVNIKLSRVNRDLK